MRVLLHAFMRCGKGGLSTSQEGPRSCERIAREGAHRHIRPYAHEFSWREGIRVHRRGDYTRAVYTRPPRLKSEAADAFKSFRVAAENNSGSKLHAVMIDNARELSMGEVRDIC